MIPDVHPYLASDTEVGVALTFPDGNALYLTADEWDELTDAAEDALATDAALIHSELAAEKRHDEWNER